MKVLFNIIVVLFCALLMVSCSSLQKEEYKVISHFLKDKDAHKILLGFPKDSDTILFDTILISEKMIKNNRLSSFSNALDWEEMFKRKQMRFHNVFWKDSSKRINLSESEIKNFKNQLNDENENFKLEQKNITAENCIVVSDFFPFNIDNFEYNYYKIKKLLPVYSLSRPLFNHTKDIALFGLIFYSNESGSANINSKCHLLIYKKNKNKWEYLGYVISLHSNF